MSSINTNQSALVALQNLKYTNKNLSQIQNEVSTGKTISNARDDAALWAVAAVIETDIQSFKTISSSLNLGEATVGTARNASEKIKEALESIKDKIERSQEKNVDRGKLQTEIENHKEEITNFINAAQYNGLSLLQGGESLEVLSSINRTQSGVDASFIKVERLNLGTDTDTVAGTALSGAGASTAGAATIADGAAETLTLSAGAVTTSNVAGASAGYSLTLGSDTVSYVLREGENQNDAVKALVTRYNELGNSDVTLTANTVANTSTDDATISIENNTGAALSFTTTSGDASTVGGELAGLDGIDVTSDEGSESALRTIERLVQASIDTAAHFGSHEKRIENQEEFVSNLVDSLTVGVSALVDSDLEDASARLKSLQVQQQLGVQALSIANNTPQQLLTLFR